MLVPVLGVSGLVLLGSYVLLRLLLSSGAALDPRAAILAVTVAVVTAVAMICRRTNRW